jgi:hypothetical protein
MFISLTFVFTSGDWLANTGDTGRSTTWSGRTAQQIDGCLMNE